MPCKIWDTSAPIVPSSQDQAQLRERWGRGGVQVAPEFRPPLVPSSRCGGAPARPGARLSVHEALSVVQNGAGTSGSTTRVRLSQDDSVCRKSCADHAAAAYCTVPPYASV